MGTTVQDIFKNLPSYFKRGGLDRRMSIYFSIGDDESGKCTVFISPDSCEVKAGKAVDKADLVLKATPEIFIKMVMEGYVPGTMDFMRGKIKSNDPTGLLALKQAFKFPGD